MQKRRNSSTVKLGDLVIGGKNPIVIQSMTNTPTSDATATINQIDSLAHAGAQVVRLAVLNENDASSLSQIIDASPVPLVADIHFDHQLALKAIDAGVHGLRLNPGNIREQKKVAEVVESAGNKNIPIRIGVNAGSLDTQRYPHPNPQAMVESALEHIKILESLDFNNIKVSLKASDIATMVEANRLFCNERDYPLHLGVTEAGTKLMSTVRSSIGIGTLLLEGIGDTLRVSVSGDPVQEIAIANEILISLGLKKGLFFIGCPTCGRTTVAVDTIIKKLQANFSHINENIKIAVMGCVVNGPGEAREADIALIGGPKESLIYLNGTLYEKILNKNTLPAMEAAIEKFIQEKKQ